MMRDYTVAFVIPPDGATRARYERVVRRMRETRRYLTTVIASGQQLHSVEYPQAMPGRGHRPIVEFADWIERANLVVVDLTHDDPIDPDLHVAVENRRTILRLAGRPLPRRPFDFRNQIYGYGSDRDLQRKIETYLKVFVIGMTRNDDVLAGRSDCVGLEQHFPDIELDATGTDEPALWRLPVRARRFRTVGFECDFRAAVADDAWCGVLLGLPGDLPSARHAICFGRDGMVQIARRYRRPGITKVQMAPIEDLPTDYDPLHGLPDHDISIRFESHEVAARRGDVTITKSLRELQDREGMALWLAVWRAKVRFIRPHVRFEIWARDWTNRRYT
jgi:hypothetical protein